MTSPSVFVGTAPCRVVDTRGATGTFGGPSLSAASPRSFPIPSGPCPGIPGFVQAYSLNITATKTAGPGFLKVYPSGFPAPVVSTLNYVAAQTVSNAAVVSAGSGGAITVVAGVSGADLIIDINGYFAIILSSSEALSLASGNSIATIEGSNLSPAGAGVLGINGSGGFFYNQGPKGVLGLAGATGAAFGVVGSTTSIAAGAAGVFGEDGGGYPGFPPGLSSGVYGASLFGYGVWGVSRVVGVKGSFLDSAGNAVTAGYLAHDDINGVFASGGIAATGTKSFVDPHPMQAGKAIVYVALEGPEAGTYFRGRGRIHDGAGVIPVPESFRMVSDEEGLTVQITPIGEAASVAVVSADLTSVAVRSPAKELEFYYVVNGVRRAFREWDPLGQPDYFAPESADARMPPGLSEEQRRLLVANGTYNEDGTVNRATAERLGWAKMWADRQAGAAAAAEKARATLGDPPPRP
ncbi:MAG TPA: hypothetical protein VKE50_00295 [Thermoanaerobaculia bacterium]|nr:hypothetical protein [Thermoanaerobaculia bacterium]